MKHFFVILLFVHCTLLIVNGQPTLEWVRQYNGTGNTSERPVKLAVDKFGNVYVAGWDSGSPEGNNIVSLKYNSTGVLQWANSYNYSGNSNDLAYSMSIDTSGNVYVAGYTGISTGPNDGLLIKYNTNSIFQWAKTYNSGGNDEFWDVKVDRQQNICVTGASNGKAVVIKYTPNGDTVWTRIITQYTSSIGSSMEIDYSNNVYICGQANTVNFLTAKFTIAGDLLWSQLYTHSGYSFARDIALDSTGSVISTGNSIGSWGNADYATVKYNNAGVLQWARRYGEWQYTSDIAYAVGTDKLNNVYVTGSAQYPGNPQSDFVTIKYNLVGDSLWVRNYNGQSNLQDEAIALSIDTNNNIYITGRSVNPSTYNIATLKYSTNGIQSWVMIYNSNSGGVDVFVDFFNNVYVTGWYIVNSQDILTIKYNQPVGIINSRNKYPGEFTLFQNYPNPFNSRTVISYYLPKNDYAVVIVYDMLGREIKELINGYHSSGFYSLIFDALGIPSGVYFYRILTKDYSNTLKMIVAK